MVSQTGTRVVRSNSCKGQFLKFGPKRANLATLVYYYDNNGRNCLQHWTNRTDDYYVTHGHGLC